MQEGLTLSGRHSMPRCLRLCFLVAALVLTNTGTARACQFEWRSEEQLFAEASAVFVAHVFRTEEVTEEAKAPSSRAVTITIVEATFRIVEIFKGQPPRDGKVKSLVHGENSCTMPVLAGHDYLFFLHKDGFAWEHNGSTKLYPEIVHRDLLKRLRKLSREAK